jgi:GntR family transcriptional regulator
MPLYQQVKEDLREAIEAQALLPDDALPSETRLSRAYEVSRATVRRAVNDLIQEGVLQRVDGVGVFVAPPKLVDVFPTVLGFSARMRASGHATISRVLVQQGEPARPSVARRLRIKEGTSVLRLVRLRIVDNDPLVIETAFLSLDRFPDLLHDDFALRSLYDILAARYAVSIYELHQSLEPVLLTDYEADLLDGTPGHPAMLIEVVAYTGEHDPFEYSKAIIRGDKCKYLFRIRSPR